jgi:hypothetical protein
MKNWSFVFVLISFLFSCSKDRITTDEFQSMDEFFEQEQAEVQEFVITNEDGDQPIIGKFGTELFVHSSLFEDTTERKIIEVPYKIKLIELYTVKDLILQKMHSNYIGGGLDYVSALWISAEKDDVYLKLIDGKFVKANLNTEVRPFVPGVYYGGNQIKPWDGWLASSSGSSVGINNEKYEMNLANLGWNMAARFQSLAPRTNIKFNYQGKGLENIQLFAFVNNERHVIKGGVMEIQSVPVNRPVTLIAMAIDQNNDFRFFRKGILATGITDIKIEFETLTREQLLLQLTALD